MGPDESLAAFHGDVREGTAPVLADTTPALGPFTPRSGVATPWLTPADVRERVARRGKDIGSEDVLARAALAASNLLFAWSGRKYPGPAGPVTVRPVARPVDVDTRIFSRFLPGGFWSSSWGSCSWSGPVTAAVSHFGCARPASVALGVTPVTEIDSVTIDGVVIPPDEYRLDNYAVLVRMLPTATSQPTQRGGWPTCQSLYLPPTEPGTFAVILRYGVGPPVEGFVAAQALAAELALAMDNQATNLPRRVTTVARQGVTSQREDPVLLRFGRGIPEVAWFLDSENPQGLARDFGVWSPDIDGPLRTRP